VAGASNLLEPPSAATTIAVVLGASEYPQKSTWTNPVLGTSARGVRDYLRSPGGLAMKAAQVLDLFDAAGGPQEQLFQIEDFLNTAGADARDLIVYYVGHGCFDQDDYCLGIRTSQRGREFLSTIESKKLARIIREAFARKRVYVVLDSCFAASAAGDWQGDEIELAVKKMSQPLPRHGTAFLAAASRHDVTRAPRDARYTVFTGAVLDALTAGVERAQPGMSLRDLYEEVRDRLERRVSDEEACPELHVPSQKEGDVSRLELFPNPGYRRWAEAARVRTEAQAGARATIAEWIPGALSDTEREPAPEGGAPGAETDDAETAPLLVRPALAGPLPVANPAPRLPTMASRKRAAPRRQWMIAFAVGAPLAVALAAYLTGLDARPAPEAPPRSNASTAEPVVDASPQDAPQDAGAEVARPVPAGSGDGASSGMPSVNASAKREPAPPRLANAKDIQAVALLIKQARDLERQGQWAAARVVYQRLEKTKGYNPAEALYHQAWAAFQSNAAGDAVEQLAADAARSPGEFQLPATFLYGDALYREHEYTRAKVIYASLRKRTSGEDRTVATKKIEACNKALKLPDNDGLVD
jgi:hypothetical protein